MSYRPYRATLSPGDLPSPECVEGFDSDLTDTSFDDNVNPPSGAVFIYLIAVEADGQLGTLGFGTCAEREATVACTP